MIVAAIPTSSASVERLISAFTLTIGDQQLATMEDTMEVPVLARFNSRKKRRRRRHRFDDTVSPEVAADDFSAEEVEEDEIVLEEGAI